MSLAALGRRPGQRECRNLRTRRRVQIAAATGGDDDVLARVFADKRHRDGMSAGLELDFPQQFAVSRIERAKTTIVGGADKQQTAGGGDASAHVQRAGLVKAL